MKLITNRNGTETYEYTDLNRVETAVAAVAAQFPVLGITVTIKAKTDWGLPGDFSAASWPVVSQMERYLRNVKTIQMLFPNAVRLPSSMDGLTAEGANSIEKVLLIAFERIEGIKEAYRYSGELIAGEEI